MKTIIITMTDDDADLLLENIKCDEENGMFNDAFNLQIEDTDD
jgi:hypothetical protein